MRLIDLTGLKFGRLTIISKLTDKTKDNHVKWLCKCDCGNISNVVGNALRSGNSLSCGCLKIGANVGLNKPQVGCKTKEYIAWYNIKTRCYNTKHSHYKYYGGKGITVCDRWLESYHNFLTDMDKVPTPFHSIERLSNSIGYSKENCKWATTQEQSLNKTNSVHVYVNGENYTRLDFLELCNISPSTYYYYIKKLTPQQIHDKFKPFGVQVAV